MNETDKITLSLVPYAPEKRRKSFLSDFFISRKRMYLFFSALFVFFFFFGYSCGKKYQYADIALYRTYFSKWLTVMTLAAYISSFTIFSPVIAVLMMTIISAYIAFIFSFGNFTVFPLYAVSAILSVIYLTEIFCCFNRAKFGVKQIFKAKPVIVISIMTAAFLLSLLTLVRFY